MIVWCHFFRKCVVWYHMMKFRAEKKKPKDLMKWQRIINKRKTFPLTFQSLYRRWCTNWSHMWENGPWPTSCNKPATITHFRWYSFTLILEFFSRMSRNLSIKWQTLKLISETKNKNWNIQPPPTLYSAQIVCAWFPGKRSYQHQVVLDCAVVGKTRCWLYRKWCLVSR